MPLGWQLAAEPSLDPFPPSLLLNSKTVLLELPTIQTDTEHPLGAGRSSTHQATLISFPSMLPMDVLELNRSLYDQPGIFFATNPLGARDE